ncbi:DNA translocase FtsK 4TM domain-containing protein [Salmonella enterica subsp. enterica serovar Kentucky]|nr:DNA translocase FtsK 4TM domain-containing protein [Salmonella enterica subsp. enterica serovar Kentucky]
MAALLSFNPSDPSWSQTAWHEPIHNLGGAPGACAQTRRAPAIAADR